MFYQRGVTPPPPFGFVWLDLVWVVLVGLVWFGLVWFGRFGFIGLVW